HRTRVAQRESSCTPSAYGLCVSFSGIQHRLRFVEWRTRSMCLSTRRAYHQPEVVRKYHVTDGENPAANAANVETGNCALHRHLERQLRVEQSQALCHAGPR